MRRLFFQIYLLFLALAVIDYAIRLPNIASFELYEFVRMVFSSSVPALMGASVVFLAGDLFWVVCLPLVVWGVVCTGMEWFFRSWFISRGIIGEQLLVTIVTLNGEKMLAFLRSSSAWPYIAGCIVLGVLTAAFVVWSVSRQVGNPTMRTFVAGAVIFASGCFLMPYVVSGDHLIRAFLDHAYMNNVDNASLYCDLAAGGEPLVTGTYRTSESNLLGVVVIGESATRNDWSLYGYSRPTTPRLEARADLIVFSNVTANACLTPFALRDELTSAGDGRLVSLPVRAVSAGFDSVLLSGQPRAGVWDGADELLFKACRKRLYLCDAVSKDELYYDGALVPLFSKELVERRDTANRLFFIHLMGSHYPTQHRYPRGFGLFGPDYVDRETADICPNGRWRVNEYDNSIQYTDKVLSELLTLTEHTGSMAFFAYFSDHGESPRSVGRDRNHPDTYAIPFIIWLSASYRTAYPDRVRRLRELSGAALTSADCQPILDELLGLKPQRSLP